MDDVLRQFVETFKFYYFQKKKGAARDLDQHRDMVLDMALSYHVQVRDIIRRPEQFKPFFQWLAATQIFFLDLSEAKKRAKEFVSLQNQGIRKPRTRPTKDFLHYLGAFSFYAENAPGFSRPESFDEPPDLSQYPYYLMHLRAFALGANIHPDVVPYKNLTTGDAIAEFHRSLRSSGIPPEKIQEIHGRCGRG